MCVCVCELITLRLPERSEDPLQVKISGTSITSVSVLILTAGSIAFHVEVLDMLKRQKQKSTASISSSARLLDAPVLSLESMETDHI